jgi:thioredoxin reductase (NADPH)
MSEPKIKFLLDTVVEEITGETFVDKIKVHNVKSNETTYLKIDGVFVNVGSQPATGYLKGLVEMDSNGAIVADNSMATSVPGIFTGGDIRSGSIRQVISAAGDGSVAAVSAGKYISG